MVPEDGDRPVDLLIIEINDGLLFDILQAPKKENAGMIDRIMYGYIETLSIFRSHGQNKMHLKQRVETGQWKSLG